MPPQAKGPPHTLTGKRRNALIFTIYGCCQAMGGSSALFGGPVQALRSCTRCFLRPGARSRSLHRHIPNRQRLQEVVSHASEVEEIAPLVVMRVDRITQRDPQNTGLLHS